MSKKYIYLIVILRLISGTVSQEDEYDDVSPKHVMETNSFSKETNAPFNNESDEKNNEIEKSLTTHTTETTENIVTTDTTSTVTIEVNITTPIAEKTKGFFERAEDEFGKDVKAEAANICPAFKNGDELNITSLVGKWKTAYYDMPGEVQCFEMEIRETSLNDRQNFTFQFGDLQKDWNQCELEILSLSEEEHRHLLIVEPENLGVLKNVIVVNEDGTHKLREEAPDQWRVFGDLLIMRDCKTGGVVVFARVPTRPKLQTIAKALKIYGEANIEGRLSCENENLVRERF